MKKLLFSFGLLFSFYYCFGQVSEAIITHTIDSLDQIRPEVYRMVNSKTRAYCIKVRNQSEFDELNNEIAKAIEIGKNNIYVRISKGTYRFNENHIRLKGLYKDLKITISGKKAVLTSCSDLKKIDNDPWQNMIQLNNLIQIVDEDKKLCFIPYPNQWGDEDRISMTKVQVTQWFRARVYDVEKIDEKGIYFVAKELGWTNEYGRKGYNVNLDYLYLGAFPRFRLFDERISIDSKASCFLRLENVEGISLVMTGLSFCGNSDESALMLMNDVKANHIYVHNCFFKNIHGHVGFFSNVSNVIFESNRVNNTNGNEIKFVNNCENVRIINNVFENCGKALGQTFCVTCWESSYYVAYNHFIDFGYSAIGVGVWHGYEKIMPSQGIIEYNEMNYSPTYYSNYFRHTLMDGGAIYAWTQNDCVIIRNNYIHDIIGMGDNRGIFCDDGANNIKIYNNIILNTPNCFSIDSRFVKDPENKYNCNAYNFMAHNIVDNKVRFMGYATENRHCMKGYNIILTKKANDILNNIYDFLEFAEKDVYIEGWGRNKGILVIPRQYKPFIKGISKDKLRYR